MLKGIGGLGQETDSVGLVIPGEVSKDILDIYLTIARSGRSAVSDEIVPSVAVECTAHELGVELMDFVFSVEDPSYFRRSSENRKQPKILLMNCLLDREAYVAKSSTP